MACPSIGEKIKELIRRYLIFGQGLESIAAHREEIELATAKILKGKAKMYLAQRLSPVQRLPKHQQGQYGEDESDESGVRRAMWLIGLTDKEILQRLDKLSLRGWARLLREERKSRTHTAVLLVALKLLHPEIGLAKEYAEEFQGMTRPFIVMDFQAQRMDESLYPLIPLTPTFSTA